MGQENVLNIKSIVELHKNKPTAAIGFLFTRNWIFATWYEKIIVASCYLFSLYSLIKFGWSLL